ncbi:MAG TPA: cytochrome P450 [Pseudonocardiaceae bacterium]|jgi:cytochrome P450 monooxygenase|nr:cytochrome P450 [Pseudonocardiaceae bacterium]
MTMSEELPALGTELPHIGCLNAQLRTLQASGPIHRVRTPAGDEGWLVTRYAELIELLMDDRVGKSHPDAPNMPKYLDNRLLNLSVSADHAEARENHAQMRARLTPLFSPKRMSALRPKIAERVTVALDAIIDKGSPADLHGQLAVPVSFHVLCDLLGIPDGDADTFMGLLAGPTTVDSQGDIGPRGLPLARYLKEMAAHKRAHPAGDLISGLCETVAADDLVAALVAVTAFSYLVTPHNISVGIALLASHPDQRDKIVAEPTLLATAVEEVLRMGKTTESRLPRYASEDIDIADVTIQAGDLVMCDHYAPAFDDRIFDHPDQFDVTRSPNPHPAFSHGRWYCVGAPLARVEMLEVYGGLLTRLPHVSLQVPLTELRVTSDQLGGGIAELPVAW